MAPENRLLLMCAVFVILIGVVASIAIDMSTKAADGGTTGDLWGGILGVAASLAATILFYAALRLQRHDLQLQRKEMSESRQMQRHAYELQRQEMREMRSVAEGQRELLRRQGDAAVEDSLVRQFLELAKTAIDLQVSFHEPSRNGLYPHRELIQTRLAQVDEMMIAVLEDERLAERTRSWLQTMRPGPPDAGMA